MGLWVYSCNSLLGLSKISYSTFCINHKSEIFGLPFHRCEDGGIRKFSTLFFTQMIYGQMAIFCKPYTSTQQRELSCVALKNETKALDELFWCCFMDPHSTQKSENLYIIFSAIFMFYFRALCDITLATWIFHYNNAYIFLRVNTK